MIALYQMPGACSLAPMIALHAAGIPHETIVVDLLSHQLADGSDYRTINPKGAVPTLRTEQGDLLTEVAVLLQYISALAPDAGLIPRDGIAHYRMLEMINFIATEVHKGFPPPKAFFPNYPADAWNMAADKFRGKLTFLAHALGGEPYLIGNQLTAADAYLFTILRSAMRYDFDFAAWPTLVDYVERLAEHPAIRAALEEEGLNRVPAMSLP